MLRVTFNKFSLNQRIEWRRPFDLFYFDALLDKKTTIPNFSGRR